MKLRNKIKNFALAILVGTTLVTVPSCSDDELDALLASKNALIDTLDDKAAEITEPGRTYRVTNVERAIANVSTVEGEDSNVEVIANAKVNGNDTKIAFTFKGKEEEIKALDTKSEEIYNTKEAEELIEYLDQLHNFIEANINNCNVNTSYKQADNVKDLTLTKNDAIVGRVISHYALSGTAVERAKITELLEKTKDAQFNNSISVDLSNKTAYVYANFNIHTFQIGVKINTEAEYTEAEIITMVTQYFNGEAITDDLTIEIIPGSEVWIAAHQQALWNNINKNTTKEDEVTNENVIGAVDAETGVTI